ncbi:MAG: hypothetical protein KDA88_01070 [Planctomycetaceae bacterium]|nr:hypothetical protein [Planctomycetaceae bacterium]MCB9952435.1 hypothetical protein [Planctomycetaceae bacterium]
MNLKSLALAISLIPVLSVVAQADEPSKAEVERYLNQISESHSALYKVGERFGKTLAPLLQGREPDSREVHRSFRDVAQTLGRVRRDVKTWDVPDHPTARKLAVANDEFMEYQVTATLEWLPSILDIMEDDSKSLEQRAKDVLEELEAGGAKENEVGTKVREAYTRLANQFDIDVE